MPCIMEIEYKIAVIDKKITELKFLVERFSDDNLAVRLMDLIDAKRDMLVDINTAHSSAIVDVCGDKVHMSNVKVIIESIDDKIDTLSRLIMDPNNKLDKLKLQDQRDRFYNEKIILLLEVNKYNINVHVG